MLAHKFRDWLSKKMTTKRYGSVHKPAENTIVEKSGVINQNSNFEPLASTIAGSRITFGDSSTDNQINESAIYY